MIARRPIADWLGLTATPTFAAMALLTAAFGSDAANALCAGAGIGSPLGGMVPMYLLMSAFHAGPWLRRLSS